MEIKDDEKKVLTDHDYDGIQELDNALPPWWINLFFITIIFGVIYFIGMQYVGWFDQQEDEYKSDWDSHNKAVAAVAAKEEASEKLAAEKRQGSNEMSVVQGPSEADIKAGKSIYLQHCAACHLPDGGGIVGPNLTDDFWINGAGTLEDIKKVVSVGVPEKGMIPWKPKIGSKNVALVSVYILSLKGTKPATPKAAEGKEYKSSTLEEKVSQSKVPALLPADVEAGKIIYATKCAVCHLPDGGGLVGPNLTDKFWITGDGSLKGIIEVVTKGVPEKGMEAWGLKLSKKHIKQVSSFIKNMNGTTPAKAKAPQGNEIK